MNDRPSVYVTEEPGYMGGPFERESTEPMTLERFAQLWVEVLASRRTSFWYIGDLAAWRLKRERTRAGKATALKELAAAAHQTAAWVRIHVQVANAFGTEQRYRDVSEALFHACVKAEPRTGRKAGEILDDALAKGWHAADVNRLGRRATTLARVLEATCGGCGAEVWVRTTDDQGVRAGEPALPCPRCIAWAWADGRDAREVERLGVLT